MGKGSQISIRDLRSAIPDSCFRSSVVKSVAYLVRDIAYASALAFLALQIDLIPSPLLRICAWAAYGLVQGFVFTGLWIIAHECGHGGFSKYGVLNDIVGWAVHSALMVPYFSWKITHARHHRYTGHMEKDTAFVPSTETDVRERKMSWWGQVNDLLEETPGYTFVHLLGHQLFGWQLYLFFYLSAGNDSLPEQASGGKRQTLLNASHFDPQSLLWTPSQRPLILMTDIGLAITAFFLYGAAGQIGFLKVALLYVVPYLWVHHWLVAITYLHHTHPSVPHLSEEKWNFTDGALCTIDRSIGFVGRHFFHEIIDYHVVHHLFPKIPFYHAEEATKAIMPLLGPKYREEKDQSFLGSLYSTYRDCSYVSDPSGTGVMEWATAKI